MVTISHTILLEKFYFGNEFKALVESNVSFIYIGKGMFKQNIYGNEGKLETSAHPDIINTASFVQTVWFIQT